MNDYRILVVDDEEDLCEILKFNLENEGYFVDTANSAEEALKMELTQYNLLLLDVMMGEISGFKMANMLKKNKATLRHLPEVRSFARTSPSVAECCKTPLYSALRRSSSGQGPPNESAPATREACTNPRIHPSPEYSPSFWSPSCGLPSASWTDSAL